MPAKRSISQTKPFRYVDVCQVRSSASLGEVKVGKVRVDGCFLMSKTQWGKFRGQDAGLMYLDLTFHQPADCKLAQATITMNFRETERRRRQTNTSSLEITEFFGPQILTGEKRERQVSKTFEATPKVGAANASVEGIGISRKSQANYASRWKFTGSRFTNDSGDDSDISSSRYRQLVWHLEENELERQAVHHSIVHTALAFHHDPSPFYLDLQIEVKMQRWHQRILQRLLCPPRDQKALTRAKIKPVIPETDDPLFTKLVKNINQTMVEENLQPVAEVSDPKPAAFADDTQENDPESGLTNISLPNEALLVLARQLTGNQTPSTLALPGSCSAASTQTVNSSDSTLVESETVSQPDYQEEIKSASCKTGDPVTVYLPKESIKTATIQEHASLVALYGVRHTSQFLAALIAWLILGLSALHAGLTRAVRDHEKY
ncbi:hypothetical protein BO79DRAFT_247424 [Aspergillus costaricaensis CBS 115574]|uniref:Uncharacterized protein n=1 Tax=Aspergillus costaricaensis CBS 115574 TaxID=1448317 RepID=A0ACD1I594_9EURO|nr:hypothetical protein BO79DRAFT_247424 [Aspergillus costaricaensis CBS 115574]RAK85672.1 hypothetical protein BO79DRAFT_247424 [Aspergillus costaricaensis CBS 115574]